MLILKGAWNGIGGFIAFVLSIVLILVLIAMPVMFAVQMTLEPATIQEIVLNLADTAQTQQPSDPQEAMMQQMLQSQTVQDLFGLYIDDLFAQMSGQQSGLTREALHQIARNNMDELTPMIRLLAEGSGADLSAVTDAQIEAQVLDLVEQHGAELLNKLPTLEQIGVTPIPEPTADSLLVIDMDLVERVLNFDFRREDLSKILTQMLLLLNDFLGLKLLGFAAGVLSLLILFFRLGGGFRGFSWLGTNYLISSILCLCMGFYGRFMISQMFARADAPPIGSILQPVVNWFLIGSAAVLVLGILFGTISAKGDTMLAKRRAKKRAA